MSKYEKRCFFCGEENELVLEEHHLVPRAANFYTGLGETVILCANCHRKMHHLLRPLSKYLELVKVEEEKEAPEMQDKMQDKLQKVLSVLTEMEHTTIEKPRAVKDDDLYQRLEEDHKISRGEAGELLGVLLREGIIFTPKLGYFKNTREIM